MKTLFKVVLLHFLVTTCFAQTPNLVNYQAIVRDAQGLTLPGGTNVTIRFTIHQDSPTGPVVFQETNIPRTNQFGLINCAIGSVSNLGVVNWANGAKYLQVEIDPTGGNSFTDMGTSQLLSVPYALYAAKSGSATTGALADTITDQKYFTSKTTFDSLFVSLETVNNGKYLVVDSVTGQLGIGQMPQTGWSLTGNTNAGNNFIGTVDNTPVKIKVNNILSATFSSDGFRSNISADSAFFCTNCMWPGTNNRQGTVYWNTNSDSTEVSTMVLDRHGMLVVEGNPMTNHVQVLNINDTVSNMGMVIENKFAMGIENRMNIYRPHTEFYVSNMFTGIDIATLEVDTTGTARMKANSDYGDNENDLTVTTSGVKFTINDSTILKANRNGLQLNTPFTLVSMDSASIYALTPAPFTMVGCTDCSSEHISGAVLTYIGGMWRRMKFDE